MKTQSEGNGREIEKKYRIKNFGYGQARTSLGNTYGAIEEGISIDVFFASPGNDFVRLRENTQELTVKRTDRGSTLNRLELNLRLESGFSHGRVWANEVFGKELGYLRTTFSVFHTGLAVISLYKTHLSEEVFFEIEVQDEKDIKAVEDEWKYLGLEHEPKSLFQIFFGEKKK